ncbi:hypothetical protein A3715_17195 [Oleiphilus sp. HI0009]|nr:hypothetical protein A3715_17195 [Oleiphilus sp. HI0009]
MKLRTLTLSLILSTSLMANDELNKNFKGEEVEGVWFVEGSIKQQPGDWERKRLISLAKQWVLNRQASLVMKTSNLKDGIYKEAVDEISGVYITTKALAFDETTERVSINAEFETTKHIEINEALGLIPKLKSEIESLKKKKDRSAEIDNLRSAKAVDARVYYEKKESLEESEFMKQLFEYLYLTGINYKYAISALRNDERFDISRIKVKEYRHPNWLLKREDSVFGSKRYRVSNARVSEENRSLLKNKLKETTVVVNLIFNDGSIIPFEVAKICAKATKVQLGLGCRKVYASNAIEIWVQGQESGVKRTDFNNKPIELKKGMKLVDTEVIII